MKSFIILVLLVILAAGSALSKPSEDNFKAYIKQRAESTQTSLIAQLGADAYADGYVQQCTFKNRVLWETVTRDGKDVYVGCFSHWFGGDEVTDLKQDLKKDLAKDLKDTLKK